MLQIMAERHDGSMTVDDCAKLSREMSMVLDVEDPIPGEYVLEVSSPGIDRPLVDAEDFVRFTGFEARVEMDLAIDGRRRFKGRILGADPAAVNLHMLEGDVVLPFNQMRRAKLMISDELLDAAKNGTLPPPGAGGPPKA